MFTPEVQSRPIGENLPQKMYVLWRKKTRKLGNVRTHIMFRPANPHSRLNWLPNDE